MSVVRPVVTGLALAAIGLLVGCQPVFTVCGTPLQPGQTNTGSLTVAVIDAQGQPESWARLIVSRNQTGVTCPNMVEAVTNGQGEAQVTDLVPGNYSINVAQTDPALYVIADVQAGRPTRVTLSRPRTTTP
jgi:hypothetical protein